MTTCNPVWYSDMDNQGHSVTRCRTCGTYKGGPCRRVPEAPPAATDQPSAGQVDIERLREIGAAWMSEEGRDAMEDWIASLTPTAPQATPETNKE